MIGDPPPQWLEGIYFFQRSIVLARIASRFTVGLLEWVAAASFAGGIFCPSERGQKRGQFRDR